MKAWVHVSLPALAETIRFIWDHHVPGRSIGLTPAMSGAGFVFARERLSIPVFEIQFAPRDHEDGGGFDNVFGTLLNEIRGSIGLQPLQRGWLNWLLTHDRTIGLYPRWFLEAARPGWQTHVIPTHYLFEPQDDARPLPDDLDAFLTRGSPPLAVTFGSYASTDADLYRHVIDACTATGERLVILTRYTEQLPVPLPADCICVPYVSLERLLTRTKAVIHHGGAGTIAQAFRAGIPQIVCPMAFDQFVNADAVVALGCGVRIEASAVSAMMLRDVVHRVITDPHMRAASQRIARYFDPAVDATAGICGLIEGFAREAGVTVETPRGQ